jgi:hypothetical protein
LMALGSMDSHSFLCNDTYVHTSGHTCHPIRAPLPHASLLLHLTGCCSDS